MSHRPERRPSHRRKHLCRRRILFESLERRQLLAANFIVDASGRDVELQRSDVFIQVLDRSDNSVIRQEAVTDIDSREIEISAGSLRVDSIVDLDVNSLIVSAEMIEVVGGSIASDGWIPSTAEEQPTLLGSVVEDVVLRGLRSTRNQTIRIENATLDGQGIVIAATGLTSTGWDELGAHQDGIAGELLTQLEAIPQLCLAASVHSRAKQSFIPRSPVSRLMTP